MKTTKHRIITKTIASIPEESTIFITRLGQIADRVEALLEQKGWTQKDLAKAMGKRESEVSKWLNTPYNLSTHISDTNEVFNIPNKSSNRLETAHLSILNFHSHPPAPGREFLTWHQSHVYKG